MKPRHLIQQPRDTGGYLDLNELKLSKVTLSHCTSHEMLLWLPYPTVQIADISTAAESSGSTALRNVSVLQISPPQISNALPWATCGRGSPTGGPE